MKTIKIFSGNTKQFAVDEFGRSYVFVEGNRTKTGKKVYRWELILTPEQFEALEGK